MLSLFGTDELCQCYCDSADINSNFSLAARLRSIPRTHRTNNKKNINKLLVKYYVLDWDRAAKVYIILSIVNTYITNFSILSIYIAITKALLNRFKTKIKHN